MTRAIGAALAAVGLLAGAARAAEPDRAPLFYQDPDGKPLWSAAPAKTPDGRDYRPVFDDAAGAPGPKPAAAADRKPLYYRNPMGLPDTSPRPKKDSMGMDYVPVFADEGAGGGSRDDPAGTVRIPPGRLQTLGVRTEAAEMRPSVSRAIRATGIVQFDERRLATVTTKAPGWIEHLAVAATGDAVRRGQVLAQIYSPDLVASEQEYLVAARMGGDIAAAAASRLEALDVPGDEVARLRRTGRASRRIAVLAPADGVVVDKPAQEGARAAAGEPLFRTADLSDVWLVAQVQEQDVGAVAPGQAAHARFVAYPGRRFEGTVELVYPSLSADTRTARVRIVIPNADGALRAAMFADVEIDAAAGGAPALSVPSSAVLDDGARQVVLVARGGGRFEPRRVRLGVRGDDRVEVTEGVKPGERVVVGANFLIDAESNLRAALQGFADGAEPDAGSGGRP